MRNSQSQDLQIRLRALISTPRYFPSSKLISNEPFGLLMRLCGVELTLPCVLRAHT